MKLSREMSAMEERPSEPLNLLLWSAKFDGSGPSMLLQCRRSEVGWQIKDVRDDL